MKKITVMAFILFSTTSYAVQLGSSNNMGAESAPRRDSSTNASMSDINRRANDSTRSTYGEESTGTRNNDTISTGQSSTRRGTNRTDAPAKTNTNSSTACVDRSGYSYYKNDSGYAACVNQSSSQMKSR
ncbi:MAG: hypothetical protein H7336_03535 [Bacteriovorax sp.]|nr:hypothetical protein [Bacteriovorax sp.]